MRSRTSVLALMLAGAAAASAQEPAFDIASVRTNMSGDLDESATVLPKRFTVTNTDETGLAGTYDLRFVYAQQIAGNPAGVASAPDAPDLLTALENQLGLDLESERVDVPVLVIESVERPSAN